MNRGSQDSNQGFFFPQPSASFPYQNARDDGHVDGSFPRSNSNELTLSQGFSSTVFTQSQSTCKNLRPFSNNFSTGQPFSQNSIEPFNRANHFSEGEIRSQIPSQNFRSPNINPQILYPQQPLANPAEEPRLNNSLQQNTSAEESFRGEIDDYSLSFILKKGVNSCFIANKNSGSTSINPLEDNPYTSRLKGKNPVGLRQPMEIGGPSRSNRIPEQPKGKLSLLPPSLTSSNNRNRSKPYDWTPPRKQADHFKQIIEGTRRIYESPSWHKNGNFSDCLHFSHEPSGLSGNTFVASYDNSITTSQKWQSNPKTSSKGKGICDQQYCSSFSRQDDRNFHRSPNILSDFKLGTQTSCQESMNNGAPDENSEAKDKLNLMIELEYKRVLRHLEERQKLSTSLQSLGKPKLANQISDQIPFSYSPGRFNNPTSHGISSFHHDGTKDLDHASQFPYQNSISSFPEGCNNPTDISSFHHDETKSNQDVSETSNWVVPTSTNLPLDSVNSIANETPMAIDVEEYQAKELEESKNSGQKMEAETDYLPSSEDQKEDKYLVNWTKHLLMGTKDQLDDFDFLP